MELNVKITIEATTTEAIPTGKMAESTEKTVIEDRMSWLELQELKARLTPVSDL